LGSLVPMVMLDALFEPWLAFAPATADAKKLEDPSP